jgi:hypothetical protein
MKRFIACALAWLIALACPVHALELSSAPSKFNIPWGASAGSAYVRVIPQASQIGVQNCAASLTDGFPPLTFVPSSAGGCPPFGADFNGIFKQVTSWSQWQGAGAPVAYDSGFSSAIGGYPAGAVLANASIAGCYWISIVDNNSSDPDTGGANWTSSCPGGGVGTATSTGSANAQVVTATPFALRAGATVCFIPGFTVTGSAKINVNGTGLINVLKTGLIALTGGEIVAGTQTCPVYDGTEWVIPTPAIVWKRTIVLTSSAAYSPSLGTAYALVSITGGGGAGGGTPPTGSSQLAGGGGGGGGGTCRATFPYSSLAAGVTVTIGPGGAGAFNSAGGTGTASTFGALLSAGGGNGSSPGAAGGSLSIAGATGGICNTSSVESATGAPGGAATGIFVNITTYFVVSGYGGGGYLGGGGAIATTSSGSNGVNATSCGGGGSGAQSSPSTPGNLKGGDGFAGCAIIQEFVYAGN